MAARLITVFGGSGFIGRYIVKDLVAAGHRVRVAVRRPNRALFLRPMGDVGQVVPVQANIRDDASVAAVLSGAEAVVNAVGTYRQRGRQTYGGVHIEGARRIAAAAAAAGASRLVHISGIGSDGASPSAYVRSKAAGEAAVREGFAGATIVRCSVVFGREDSVLNRLAALSRLSPVMPLFGGPPRGAGASRIQPVYVGDVAAATARILDDGATAGRTFALGGPQVMTYRELVEIVLRETGRRRVLAPLPFAVARTLARILEIVLPVSPISRDEVVLLEADNVVGAGVPGFAELGIEPAAVSAIAPGYLRRFRRGSSAAGAGVGGLGRPRQT